MKKKPDLAGMLRAQEEPPQPQGGELQPPMKDTSSPKASARSGLVNIAGWFPIRVKFELEELRLARSRQTGRKITSQQMMAEAYNDLFKKYGRPEVAPPGD